MSDVNVEPQRLAGDESLMPHSIEIEFLNLAWSSSLQCLIAAAKDIRKRDPKVMIVIHLSAFPVGKQCAKRLAVRRNLFEQEFPHCMHVQSLSDVLIPLSIVPAVADRVAKLTYHVAAIPAITRKDMYVQAGDFFCCLDVSLTTGGGGNPKTVNVMYFPEWHLPAEHIEHWGADAFPLVWMNLGLWHWHLDDSDDIVTNSELIALCNPRADGVVIIVDLFVDGMESNIMMNSSASISMLLQTPFLGGIGITAK